MSPLELPTSAERFVSQRHSRRTRLRQHLYERARRPLDRMPRPYKEAVPLLVKLRDLAAFQNRLPEFQARIAALQAQYASRPAFQERLHKAGLFQECVFCRCVSRYGCELGLSVARPSWVAAVMSRSSAERNNSDGRRAACSARFARNAEAS